VRLRISESAMQASRIAISRKPPRDLLRTSATVC
jgi:hypothetical protein